MNLGEQFSSPGGKKLIEITNIYRWILLALGAFSVYTLNYQYMTPPPAALPMPGVIIPAVIILLNTVLTMFSLQVKNTSMAWVLIVMELINSFILFYFYGTQFALLVLLVPLMEITIFAESAVIFFIILLAIGIIVVGMKEILIKIDKVIIPPLPGLDEAIKDKVRWLARMLMMRPVIDSIVTTIIILWFSNYVINEEKNFEKQKKRTNDERQLFQEEIKGLNEKLDTVYQEHDQMNEQLAKMNDETKDSQEALIKQKYFTKLIHTIASSKNIDEAIERTVRNIENVIPCQTSCFFMVEEEQGEKELVPKKVLSPFTEEINNLIIPLGEGIIGWVAETGQSAITGTGTFNPRGTRDVLRTILDNEPSAIAVPVMIQNEVMGVLYLSHPDKNTMTEEDEKTLKSAGIVLASFMPQKPVIQVKEDTGFRQKEDEMNSLIETLQHMIVTNKGLFSSLNLEVAIGNLVDTIISTMDSQSCLIFLEKKTEDGMLLKITAASGPYADNFKNYKVKPTEEIIGYVYRRGKDVLITNGTYRPDEPGEPEYRVLLKSELSALVIPLQTEEKTIGVIYMSQQGTGSYTVQDQELMGIMAQYGAIAIQNAIDYEKTATMGITDELTGLENRKYFERRIHEELAICRRFDYGFALALIDIDHFTRFNEIYGKEVGDLLLREIAGLLSSYCRETDCIARIEKDLFGIIFVHINKKSDAVVTSERLRNFIENNDFGTELGEALQLTVSMGVSVYPDDGDTADILFDQSYITLEEAQKSGGNRTFFMG